MSGELLISRLLEYTILLGDEGRVLDLSHTHTGFAHLSSLLYSVFVSMSLQIQAWIYFHSDIEIFVWWGVYSVSQPMDSNAFGCKYLEHSPGPRLLMRAPTYIYPSRALVTDPDLVAIRIAGCTPATAIRELWKKTRFITHRSWRVHSTSKSKGHTARSWRESEHGVLTSLGPRVGGLRFWGLTLYWWIENVWDLKGRKGEARLLKWSVI